MCLPLHVLRGDAVTDRTVAERLEVRPPRPRPADSPATPPARRSPSMGGYGPPTGVLTAGARTTADSRHSSTATQASQTNSNSP